jgi:hypothetical protein
MVLDVKPEQIANEHFDLVAIGSGFGSAFFLATAVTSTTVSPMVTNTAPSA